MRTPERDFTASGLYQKLDQGVSDVLLGAKWVLASLPVVTLVPATAALFMTFDQTSVAQGTPSPTFFKNFVKVALSGARLTMSYLAIGSGIAASVFLLGVAGMPRAVVGGVALTWSAAFTAIVFTGIGILSRSPSATRIATRSIVHAFGSPLRSLKLVLWLGFGILLTVAIPLSLAPIGMSLLSCHMLRHCNRILEPRERSSPYRTSLRHTTEWIPAQPGPTRLREGG